MQCLNCKTDIKLVKGKRVRLYCSDKCRMAYKRNNEQTNNEQPKSISEQGKTNKLEIFGKGWNGENLIYCEICLFHVPAYCNNWHDCKHYLKDYDITGVRYA